jgi:tetratricopeptide (TPR) repeat protein
MLAVTAIVGLPGIPVLAQPQPVTTDQVEPVLNPRAFQAFVEGMIFEQEGHLDSALMSYQLGLRYFPGSLELGMSAARLLYQFSRPQLAVEFLQRTSHRDLEWHLLAARCYHDMNEADSMRASYLEIARMDPENLPAFNILAGMYERMGMLDSALWAYENVVRIRSQNFRTWMEIGRLHHRRGEFDEAAEAYRKSIELEDSGRNILSILGLGMILYETGKPHEAVPYLLHTLDFDSLNTLANSHLARFYFEVDSLEKSLDYTQRLLRSAPKDRRYARLLGRLYIEMDSLSAAEFVLTGLIEGGDDSPYTRAMLGTVALETEEFGQAVYYFGEALVWGDSSASVWINLGRAYAGMNEYDEEIEVYRTGHQHATSSQDIVALDFSMGMACERADRVDSMVAAFERVLNLDPDNHQAMNYLGYSLADHNFRLDYARELIEQALDFGPENPAYLDSYGWVLYRQGDIEQAVQYLEQAARLDSDPVIFDHLGDAYSALGRQAEARSWWQKALNEDPDDELVVTLKEKLGH